MTNQDTTNGLIYDDNTLTKDDNLNVSDTTSIDEPNLDKEIEEILDKLWKDAWGKLGAYNFDGTGEDTLTKTQASDVIKALIATQINQARIEAQKEILAFATRVQANGQYVPIEVGLIPWLEAQLSNTHKEANQ